VDQFPEDAGLEEELKDRFSRAASSRRLERFCSLLVRGSVFFEVLSEEKLRPWGWGCGAGVSWAWAASREQAKARAKEVN
jgi:hypothetical protein